MYLQKQTKATKLKHINDWIDTCHKNRRVRTYFIRLVSVSHIDTEWHFCDILCLCVCLSWVPFQADIHMMLHCLNRYGIQLSEKITD